MSIPLEEQIAKALDLHTGFGPACLGDARIRGALEKYRELILKTDALMCESGVGEACSRCAQKTGSCCFAEMGESYGPLGLFVNLLLGVSLPEAEMFPGGCWFVGEKGCRLQAKHSFCLNYFCPDLKETLGPERIGRIERLIGEQLLAGWDLELLIGRRVSGK